MATLDIDENKPSYFSCNIKITFVLFIFLSQRSFRAELVKDAIHFLYKFKTHSEIQQFSKLMDRASEIRTRIQQQEMDFDDAPDEFKGRWSSQGLLLGRYTRRF